MVEEVRKGPRLLEVEEVLEGPLELVVEEKLREGLLKPVVLKEPRARVRSPHVRGACSAQVGVWGDAGTDVSRTTFEPGSLPCQLCVSSSVTVAGPSPPTPGCVGGWRTIHFHCLNFLAVLPLLAMDRSLWSGILNPCNSHSKSKSNLCI